MSNLQGISLNSGETGISKIVNVVRQLIGVHYSTAVRVTDYGATGDNVTDDGPAIQNAINYVRSLPTGGKVVLPSGKTGYRIATALDVFPSVPLEIEWGAGAVINADMTGAGTVAIKGTNPAGAASRGERLTLNNPCVNVHSNVGSNIGPVLFEYLCPSDLTIKGRGKFLHYKNNTAIRIAGAFNARLEAVDIWGSGHNKMRKTTTATFSITGGAAALVANSAVFDSTDVGRIVVLKGGDLLECFTISVVTDSTHATVSANANNTFSGAGGAFDGVKGAITSGDNTLTVETNCLTSADIGRVVYVLDANVPFGSGSPLTALRATITAVPAANQATLDVNAGNTVTASYVIFSPGVEIYDFDGSNETNDLEWDNLHLEQIIGAGLVISGGIDIRMPNVKLHCQNNTFDNTCSTFNGVFCGGAGYYFGGLFEGTPHNDIAAMYVSGISATAEFSYGQGILINNLPCISAKNNFSSARIIIGPWSFGNPGIVQASIDNAFILAGSGKLFRYGPIGAYNQNLNSSTVIPGLLTLATVSLNGGVIDAPAQYIARGKLSANQTSGSILDYDSNVSSGRILVFGPALTVGRFQVWLGAGAASATLGMEVTDLFNTIFGPQSALATTATDGFIYIPTCAGAPTGTPTSVTGKVPVVFDTTNNKIWAFHSSWKGVAVA